MSQEKPLEQNLKRSKGKIIEITQQFQQFRKRFDCFCMFSRQTHLIKSKHSSFNPQDLKRQNTQPNSFRAYQSFKSNSQLSPKIKRLGDPSVQMLKSKYIEQSSKSQLRTFVKPTPELQQTEDLSSTSLLKKSSQMKELLFNHDKKRSITHITPLSKPKQNLIRNKDSAVIPERRRSHTFKSDNNQTQRQDNFISISAIGNNLWNPQIREDQQKIQRLKQEVQEKSNQMQKLRNSITEVKKTYQQKLISLQDQNFQLLLKVAALEKQKAEKQRIIATHAKIFQNIKNQLDQSTNSGLGVL